MNLSDILGICKAYNDLGWAIQEQLETAVSGSMNDSNTNENALEYIAEFIKTIREIIMWGENDDLKNECDEVLEKIKRYEGMNDSEDDEETKDD